MITNSALNPNAFLKPFYSNTVLIQNWVKFGANETDENNVDHTIIWPIHPWHDKTFLTTYSIRIPKYTKKALVRVLVPEGVIAPKYIAFATLVDPSYLNDAEERSIALLDGSELEIYGFKEIKNLTLFNNRSYSAQGSPDTALFNPDPIPFLLNIVLYR